MSDHPNGGPANDPKAFLDAGRDEEFAPEPPPLPRKPKLPVGVIIIAVLGLGFGAYGLLWQLPFLNRVPVNFLFGLAVPGWMGAAYILVNAAISIPCCIGLLKLKNRARQVYLVWLPLTMLCGLLNRIMRYDELLASMMNQSGRQLAEESRQMTHAIAQATIILSLIVTIGYAAFVCGYLLLRRKHFVR